MAKILSHGFRVVLAPCGTKFLLCAAVVDLDQEIENWVRTVRVGKTRHQCGSLEGQYRPAAGNVELLEEAPKGLAPLRILDGWKVERAWRTVEPFGYKRLLSLHYVRNIPLDIAVRKARLTNQRVLWLKHLTIAREKLAKRLIILVR